MNEKTANSRIRIIPIIDTPFSIIKLTNDATVIIKKQITKSIVRGSF